ncbi:MAG: hypothetical protein JNM41_03285 [Flavipsychrobacter sp.]|nr:hypothetical protein [Flavipsychrobacter sp.]
MTAENLQHFLLKRMIVECAWWIQDHVMCNGNFIYHTTTEKTNFIDSIKKKVEALQIPGVSRNGNTAAATIYYIAEQREWIKHLKFQLISPLRLTTDLEGISHYHENHYNLQKELQVKFDYGTENEYIDEVRLNPKDVVCVLSDTKDRKRTILERKQYPDNSFEYKTYMLDTQKLPNRKSNNFQNLREYLDPYAHNLIITRSALINEVFYDFHETELLLNVNSNQIPEKFKIIPLSKSTTANKDVHQQMIRCNEDRRGYLNSLQKMASYYDNHKPQPDPS